MIRGRKQLVRMSFYAYILIAILKCLYKPGVYTLYCHVPRLPPRARETIHTPGLQASPWTRRARGDDVDRSHSLLSLNFCHARDGGFPLSASSPNSVGLSLTSFGSDQQPFHS